MRYELKRYIYMCDCMAKSNAKCSSVEVVEAVCEVDADNIVKQRGWEPIYERGPDDRVRRTGDWVCGQPHWKGAEPLASKGGCNG